MLIMLTIAVFVPVGLGALVLAADRRFNRPGRAQRSTDTTGADTDHHAPTAQRDPMSDLKTTYQPLRDTGGRNS